jgi:hypothetical protein
MKKLSLAVLIAISVLFAGLPAYAAAPAAHTILNVKLKEGVNVVPAGKMSYDITVKGGKVASITPHSSSSMGAMHMSSKTIKFTTTTKNGLCYWCWYDVYGRYYCVYRYC